MGREGKEEEKLHEDGRREEREMFNVIKGECSERGSKADGEKERVRG